MTASTSIVKLEVDTIIYRLHCLDSEAPPWLALTEPSVYTEALRFALLFLLLLLLLFCNEKL